jgi:N-acetylglucosamine kinase-like BadF-type ATPase
MTTNREKKVTSKPVTIRLDGVHRDRLWRVMDRLGVENPQDAVRFALKFYLDTVEIERLAPAVVALVEDRVAASLVRRKRKRGRRSAKLNAEQLREVRTRYAVLLAESRRASLLDEPPSARRDKDLDADADILRAHGELAVGALEARLEAGRDIPAPWIQPARLA